MEVGKTNLEVASFDLKEGKNPCIRVDFQKEDGQVLVRDSVSNRLNHRFDLHLFAATQK